MTALETIVKICGVTRPADAAHAAREGADWIGINFWSSSTRFVGDLDRARQLADAARAASARVRIVGVFVNQTASDIERVDELLSLDYVQLHGDESEYDCARWGARAIKALAVADAAGVQRAIDAPCPIVLLDAPNVAYGGGGATFDWELARRVTRARHNVLLAGGLSPDNVADAVTAVAPYGVDVASGVESAPGIKDSKLVRRFIRAAKGKAQ